MHSTKYTDISRRAFIRRTACAAVGTVAMTSAIRDLRFMNAAVAQSNINDYKAMVCIFLQGGNDSNNLIIPTLQSQYDNYAQIRTPVLAIPQSAILPVTSLDGDGNTYGLHPSCPELQTLFGEGKLAFMFNTGTLVYPITRSQYLSGTGAKPPQLFSHADQQTQWQTSIPDQPPASGWGGRCADLLESIQPNAPISLMVTLAGANIFEVGNIVSQYSVSTSGAISLNMPSTPLRRRQNQPAAGLDERSRPPVHETAIAGVRLCCGTSHQYQRSFELGYCRHSGDFLDQSIPDKNHRARGRTHVQFVAESPASDDRPFDCGREHTCFQRGIWHETPDFFLPGWRL